ncbi:hypothetical protein F5B17DRAFT_450273 [Nemania serpens]|nr:hypothetical protein F5B17DRAFT_450273 [Nemania serpens]
MNWTTKGIPDVETAPSKDGSTPKIEMTVWVIIALASALLTLRIAYHIRRGRRRLWSDDYFLIVALACLIGNGIAIREWLTYKFEPNVATKASFNFVLTGSLMGLFNSLALALSKTSLGITFIRLTTGWWKCSLGLSIFIIDILFVIQGWTFWVQDCEGIDEPLRVQSTMEGCIRFDTIEHYRLIVQALSCTLDAYFTILPWKIVRSLELERFEKIGLGIAMSFGCASLASGLVRMVILLRLTNQAPEYQPFYAVGGYLYNFCEPGYTIVAACMPILRKVVKDMIQWKKNTPTPNWILARRRKRASPTVLPLTNCPGDSTSPGKSTSEKTDTTLATSFRPAALNSKLLPINRCAGYSISYEQTTS